MGNLPVIDKPRRGRWIPWLFVAGFAVVIGVNATLIVAAAETFSGTVVAHPYQEGAEYNHIRAQIEAQEKLGWHYRLQAEVGRDGMLHLVAAWQNKSGLPLDGLTMTAELQRPVENMAAIPVVFQATGNGRYSAEVAVPKGGAWDLHLTASRDGVDYAAAERLVLP